jgi:hypothetical protein
VNISGRNYRSLAFDQNFNGGSFNGSLTISNATLDSLGIDLDFGTFTTTYDFSPQGGNATGSFQFTVVPEPSAYVPCLNYQHWPLLVSAASVVKEPSHSIFEAA